MFLPTVRVDNLLTNEDLNRNLSGTAALKVGSRQVQEGFFSEPSSSSQPIPCRFPYNH
ncbi:MAG TPA: hypothetical protein VKV05_03985 [Terriglobales bacterium]|nr:hypothetical protein [Terriglobales bacterium]